MKTYDYFNTWQSQCIISGYLKMSCRDWLNEDTLFNKKTGLVLMYKEVRDKLIFVLDDGWDIDFEYVVEENKFASHNIRTSKFPHFKGKPQEKLKMMVDKILSYGWKGVGLWVCAQGYGKDYDFNLNDTINTFKEKLEWSKYANVIYWKVDWGKFGNNLEFRKKLNNLKSTIYPDLIIEDAFCMPPVNGYCENVDEDKKLMYPYSDSMKEYIDKTLKFSEVFRSYDVNEEQSMVTTLQRATYLLKQNKAYINIEDELFVGAVLGLAIGVQRSMQCKGLIKEPLSMQNRCEEVNAVFNYREISKPYVGYKLYTSKEVFHVPFKYENHWKKELKGNEVDQIAPQIISRNTKLPKVIPVKKVPFVFAGLDLDNNYSIGTFSRLNFDNPFEYLVNVKVNLEKCPTNIAIFSNQIKKLIIKIKEDTINKKFVLVNLYNLKEKEINRGISLKDNKITISYESLTKSFKAKDNSFKAYMIKVLEK